jgi:phosphate starvation-inducible protein PhoH
MSRTKKPRSPVPSARRQQRRDSILPDTTPPLRPKAKLYRHDLLDVQPLTETQRAFLTAYGTGAEAMVVQGPPGTGKSFLTFWAMLDEALSSKRAKRVVLVRSAVPSRSMGFLPGTDADKLDIYQAPYRDMGARLFGVGDAYARLVAQGTIEFVSTSYLRGLTWDDALVLVDECQNMSDMELHTLMTRMGQRSRIVFCGDQGQTDLVRSGDRSGWAGFSRVVMGLPMVVSITYTADEIVRSPLVKAYLLARLAQQEP